MYVQVYTIYKFVHEETRCDEPHNKNFNLYRHSSKSSTIYSWADTIICNNRNYHFSMILHVTVVHVIVVHVIVVHVIVVHAKVVHVTVVHAKVVHVTVVHAKVVHATVVMYVHVIQRVHMIATLCSHLSGNPVQHGIKMLDGFTKHCSNYRNG